MIKQKQRMCKNCTRLRQKPKYTNAEQTTNARAALAMIMQIYNGWANGDDSTKAAKKALIQIGTLLEPPF